MLGDEAFSDDEVVVDNEGAEGAMVISLMPAARRLANRVFASLWSLAM